MVVPEHLHINGRLEDQNFSEEDLLYRGYALDEYDIVEDTIRTETIRFPDFSCNWNRYSEPIDIIYRFKGRDTDGCYSFSVITSRYQELATPVHDPIDDPEHPNYAHAEIRICRESDLSGTLPLKGRKLRSKTKKLEYRQNIANNLLIEIVAAK